jgi:hypothetical protein
VLSIVAEGLLETQLPELDLGLAEGIRQYPDQPELERQVTEAGIEARRIERFAVIAQAPGEVSIPAAELAWWNVIDARWEVATVPPQRLSVLPGQATNDPLPAPVDTGPEPATVTLVDAGYWPWATAAVSLAWLATLAAWAYSRAAPGGLRRRDAPAPQRPPSSRALLKQLKAACRVNDSQRTQRLLLEWGALQFHEDPPPSLGALADRVEGPLSEQIAVLEAQLYGRGTADWNGSKLAELLAAVNRVTPELQKGGKDPLMPLYR